MIVGLRTHGDFQYNEYFKTENIPLCSIQGFKKINIFIGSNNSGKSRLMRKIMLSQERYKYDDTEVSSYDFTHFKADFNNNASNYFKNSKFEKEYLNFASKEHDTYNDYYFDLMDFFEECLNIMFETNTYTHNLSKFDSVISRQDVKSKPINQTYIPLLRGIENFVFGDTKLIDEIRMNKSEYTALEDYKKSAKKIYSLRTSKNYNIKESEIFTGEGMYDDLKAMLLGSLEQRKKMNDYEKFLSVHFFDNQEVVIIPNKTGNINVKIGNSTDRPIYDLGDGIKQIIILLYKLFEKKDEEHYFYIEEPDINLHPGLQKKLIEILSSDLFPKHQYFITTHSNHLIDLINYDDEKISLFKVKTLSTDKFIVRKFKKDDKEVLDDLGIKSTSVFISNCTIWVEGISDRIYIKKYLKLFFEKHQNFKYKEDIHYSFLEYAGSNLKHYNFDKDFKDELQIFADSLSNNILIIADNDFPDQKHAKYEFQQHLKNILGDRYYIIKPREIENTLKLDKIKKYLKEDNKKVRLSLKKGVTINEKNYMTKNIKMGTLIDESFSGIKNYSDKYGSIKKKSVFAQGITELLTDYDDLSDEAKNLTEYIFKFIEESNS